MLGVSHNWGRDEVLSTLSLPSQLGCSWVTNCPLPNQKTDGQQRLLRVAWMDGPETTVYVDEGV